ncbi:putative hydrolase [Streptomyces sp. Tu6071]|nr:putative hydrolase [Streptomyces sp. Tu6071]
MSGQDHGRVVERQAHTGQRAEDLVRVAAGQVGASDGAGEEQVPGEEHGRQVRALGGPEGHRPLGMPGGVRDGEVEPGEAQAGPVAQLLDVGGFADRQLPHERHPDGAADAGLGVAHHEAVRRVDPGGDVVRPADRDDRGDVVDVAVGEDDGDGLEPMLRERLLDPRGGLVARVDDHAFLTGGGGDHVAVGPPGPGGETGNEHVRPLCPRVSGAASGARPGSRLPAVPIPQPTRIRYGAHTAPRPNRVTDE